MRDIGLNAHVCFLAMLLTCAFVPDGQVRAEQRSAPWDSVGCNDTCRWWMNLGSKPAADIKPAPSGPSPALSVKAIVPDADLAAAASPTIGRTVDEWLGDRTTRPAECELTGGLRTRRPAPA